MKKTTFIPLLFVLTGILVQAQKKKDLIFQIEELTSKLDTTETALLKAKSVEKSSLARVTAVEAQLSEVRQTNATLLQNLKSFSEVSSKNSENVERALASLREKENQLKIVKDALSSNDSITLAVLTAFKGSLGNEAKISVRSGEVVLSIPNLTLFGENDKNFVVQDSAKSTLEKIAKVLNANANLKFTIEGNSNALSFKETDKTIDNWDLSARQAAAIARLLQESYAVDPKRMAATGRSEYGSEAVVETITEIKIEANFRSFYTTIKEEMKNK